jgi:hypothetical protein
MISIAFLRNLGLLDPPVITYDFGDGRGAVPAHQHGNGNGWVDDECEVHDNAEIDAASEVFGFATIGPNARLVSSTVRDFATVHGGLITGSTIQDYARVDGNPTITDCVLGGHTYVEDDVVIEDETMPSGEEPPVIPDGVEETVAQAVDAMQASSYNRFQGNDTLPFDESEDSAVIGKTDGVPNEDDD